MGTIYVNYREIERFLGNDNIIRFYFAMKDRMEYEYEEPKGKKVRIGFVNYLLYMKYEQDFAENKKVPKNYDYLLELDDVLDKEVFQKLLDTYQGKSLCVSYTHIRNVLVCYELQQGKYTQKVANDYGITVAYARKIKQRYSVTHSAEYRDCEKIMQ